MLTHRMLGLLHTRLVAGAPRQAGSHEYRMGVDDTIAAVRRLVEAGMAGGSTADWAPETTEGPDQTQLAAEYVELEMASLLRTIDSILRPPSAALPPDDTAVSSLWQARDHLVQARGALRQTRGSVPG